MDLPRSAERGPPLSGAEPAPIHNTISLVVGFRSADWTTHIAPEFPCGLLALSE